MIFVDESIQNELGYICVGFAYCTETPDTLVNEAIALAGLTPGIDEYKSGYRMEGSSERKSLRDSVYEIVLQRCKIGVYIAAIHERPALGTAIIESAAKIVQVNGLDKPQAMFVDEGISVKGKIPEFIQLTSNCDSRKVPGIQLADFIAYHCSYLLKCALSGTSKKILISHDAPYPVAGEEVELDWILRTDFRRHFFVEERRIEEIKGDDWSFKLAGYGAFFSPQLNENLRKAAEATFDSMYFGCVW
ncbi:DUF3800 domain-containing protein [Pseudoduganella sp. DS3]|uniref:DUF3800 domain-containing protein n=1 Tax=Pseudoduganella guangdongensis TaxID=2692179 RepID=A0A6N9HLL0_9BURK|nr:DUF3800 domain-containing protein [Pseudoduganella guangdongensis]MYN04400.1 DUF3800 domain-containing protein [Pseudoduganella guangdongensis]